MTEDEWLHGDDLAAKIHYLGEGYSFRKARLFAVACGRTVRAINDSADGRRALDALERLADDPGGVNRYVLYRTFRRARVLFPPGLWNPDEFADLAVNWSYTTHSARVMNGAAAVCAEAAARIATGRGWGTGSRPPEPAVHEALQRAAFREYDRLLRDVAGNPFRPVAWDAAWRTADVAGVARAIYEERAFDRLPVLADALMDAGCEEDTVIRHCRRPGPHVRGCWVVDAVLGKG